MWCFLPAVDLHFQLLRFWLMWGLGFDWAAVQQSGGSMQARIAHIRGLLQGSHSPAVA